MEGQEESPLVDMEELGAAASNESINDADHDFDMTRTEGIRTVEETLAYWEHQHASVSY